jgi:hypothetical protein
LAPDSAAIAVSQTPFLDSAANGGEVKDVANAFSPLMNLTARGWWWRSLSFGAARWRGW